MRVRSGPLICKVGGTLGLLYSDCGERESNDNVTKNRASCFGLKGMVSNYRSQILASICPSIYAIFRTLLKAPPYLYQRL